jgi:ATP-dependent RNA helicase DeaD
MNVPAIEIATALAKLARGDVPLLMEAPKFESRPKPERKERPERAERAERFERPERSERPAFPKKERIPRTPDAGMQTFRIEVGYEDGVKPGNIVGAIANEAGLDAKHIGRIEIFEDHTFLDLPEGMPQDILRHLKTVWCAGQQLRITRDGEPPDTAGRKPPRGPRPAGGKPFGKKPFGGKSNADGGGPFRSGKPSPKPHRKGPKRES